MAQPMPYERKLARKARKDPFAAASDSGGVPHEEIPTADISTPETANHEPISAGPAKAPKEQIRDMVKANTQYRIPGQGVGKPEESFDEFRKRALPVIRAAMQELAHDPQARIGIVLHSQTVDLLQAWIAAGMPDDYSVGPASMQSSTPLGSADRLFPTREEPGWAIEPVDLTEKAELPAGSIYLLRHGMSDSSKPAYEKNGHKQNAMAEMVKHIKALDFGRARAFARKAADEHGMGEEEIGQMIDGALPDAASAAKLPHHHLLAVASAAGPQRRSEYAGLLKERFGGEVPQELRAHLAQLGVGQ